jgi:hypothetical protein
LVVKNGSKARCRVASSQSIVGGAGLDWDDDTDPGE